MHQAACLGLFSVVLTQHSSLGPLERIKAYLDHGYEDWEDQGWVASSSDVLLGWWGLSAESQGGSGHLMEKDRTQTPLK